MELAMKVQKITSSIFGKTHVTVKYDFHRTMMNDKLRLDYFVSLILWVKKNYASETNREMARKKVPSKKISQKLGQKLGQKISQKISPEIVKKSSK